MLRRSKLLFAALAATAAMMLVLVADASARNLRFSERAFEFVFNRPGLTFEAGGNNVTCPITLLGHLDESTIAKSLNSGIGVLTHGSPTSAGEPPCTGGTMTVLTETFPWSVTYQGFHGTLPNITGFRLLFVQEALKIRANGLTCLAGTTTRNPAAGEVLVGAGGRIESIRSDESIGIPLGGGFLCEIAGEGHLRGTATVLDLPARNAIFVTLI